MLVNVPSTSFIPLAGHSMDDELEEHTSFLDEIGRLFDSHKTSVSLLPHRTKLFSDYNEARRKVKRRIEQNNKWFFMQINYLCISYLLFVDIFTKSFDDFISMNAVFSPASLFFFNLPVYELRRFLPASPYIAPSPLFLAKICQPPRLFRPPLLFETPEYIGLENWQHFLKNTAFCVPHSQKWSNSFSSLKCYRLCQCQNTFQLLAYLHVLFGS